ncbi:FAD-dependent oxidoreductase [Psychromicrobium lacuslunae]|uniref:FAD-binding domain-containing protein n=1 Tax=Psychromicrobium lacuslunae TaxID=1618207 RepID=A0A0D4C2X5_9MICC|nr:FAD-dependent oxidoreductase [Psychromicrobium lacuslunae]AJT42904.1 hypothetical protein UM93_05395 [Psychromicrobium lacuslunae]
MERRDCVIAGGGPAGVMLGLILARAGLKVTVLEKHCDFFRDFRGDTVHPATLRVLDELGLGERFRKLPQSRLGNVQIPDGKGQTITFGDFDSLRAPYNYVAMVPQWDLLNLLVEAAQQEPNFQLMMNTTATEVVLHGGSADGVRYQKKNGETGEIRATLTVACDGRHSTLRSFAGLVPIEYPTPFDTWWFRISRNTDEQSAISTLIPRIGEDGLWLSLTRPDYFQVAYFGAKGSGPELRAAGIESFRRRLAKAMPNFSDRVEEIESIDELHFLDVKLNRLPHWYKPGFLAIGDAAHAMSPAGGVGINLAIQDAVAAGRMLAKPLLRGQVPLNTLAAIQRRRWLPMAVIQGLQRMLHAAVFGPAVSGNSAGFPRSILFAVKHFPLARKIPPRLIGFGPRPEHAPSFARRREVAEGARS